MELQRLGQYGQIIPFKAKLRQLQKCKATINTFAASLNQAVHTKTAGSHVVLHGHNSCAIST